MALLFLDSFDHYSTSEWGRKYDAVTGSGTIVQAGDLNGIEPRNGLQSLRLGDNNGFRKTFPSNNTWIMGIGVQLSGPIGGTQDHDLFTIKDFLVLSASSSQLSLQYENDKKFRIVRGDDIIGTILATSTGTFDLDDGWHYIEWQCVINQTTGSFSAQFDGVEIDGLTLTGQDTVAAGGNEFGNGIIITGLNGTNVSCWFDDLYIANGDTPGVIAMLGDMKVDALFPKADGNYEEFTTSSGTDSFALVNELPPTTDDSTYVESQTVNEKSSFDMDDAGNFVVHGAQHVVFLRKTDVNRRKMKHLTRIAGNDHKGDLVRMGDKYTMKTNMWETNPQTGSRWLHSEINGAEFGMEVI